MLSHHGFMNPIVSTTTIFWYGSRRARLSSKNRDGGASPGVSSFRRFGAVLTILCGRGAEDKRKATGSILGYRVLQVEGFERNVAARAVGADVFEIAVGEPVVSHGAASAIVQRQQEDSLAQGMLFGRGFRGDLVVQFQLYF